MDRWMKSWWQYQIRFHVQHSVASIYLIITHPRLCHGPWISYWQSEQVIQHNKAVKANFHILLLGFCLLTVLSNDWSLIPWLYEHFRASMQAALPDCHQLSQPWLYKLLADFQHGAGKCDTTRKRVTDYWYANKFFFHFSDAYAR